MAGDEGDGLRRIAMRQRDLRRGRNAQRRRDAGNDLDLDALGAQRLDLFSAAAEDEGIAALEPHHPLAGAGRSHQPAMDLALRNRMFAPGLADGHDLRRRVGQVENLRAHQPVGEDHLGGTDRPQGLQGEQFRVARAGATSQTLPCGADPPPETGPLEPGRLELGVCAINLAL